MTGPKKPLMKNTIALWTKEWAKDRAYPFLFYPQISSTNDKAKEHAFSSSNIQTRLFIAESQTKGRGQGTKTWFQSDMMLSWSWTLKKAPQPITTKLMGEALHSALKSVWKEGGWKIKKPNDIYANGKKMAGLLVEVVNQGAKQELILGVGMNVKTHPPCGPWTHLEEHITPPNVTKQKWHFFLDKWLKLIEQTLPLCTKR